MYKLKTQPTDKSVVAFIEAVDSPKKREDAFRLLDIFSETTGMEPKMWGESIIGYGAYHYKYASGHEGDAALVGFSPRKHASAFTLRQETTSARSCLKTLASIRQERPVSM